MPLTTLGYCQDSWANIPAVAKGASLSFIKMSGREVSSMSDLQDGQFMFLSDVLGQTGLRNKARGFKQSHSISMYQDFSAE